MKNEEYAETSCLHIRPSSFAIRHFLTGLIRVYQATLGPYLGGACRFYPSCSHYAVEAIETHGAIRGVGYAARRIARCHPLSKGGVDLVPVK